MLVLTRRCDEEIVMPDSGITLKVIEIKGNRVKVGISAPDSVKVVRGELALDRHLEFAASHPFTLLTESPLQDKSCQMV